MYKSLNVGVLGHRQPFAEVCALAARYGFTGVDVAGSELHQDNLDTFRQLLTTYNLQPGLVSLPLNFRGTQAQFDTCLTQLPEQAALAVELGYTRTTTVVMPGDNQLCFRENWSLHVERLRPLAEILEHHGIRLGLEFIGPKTLRHQFQHAFLHTMDGVLGLCAAIGTPNMGLLVDLFHMFTSHSHLEDIRFLRPEDIVLVHLNDALAGRSPDEQMDLERDLPGATGMTDCVAFLHRLRAIAYDGPCTVEPFQKRLHALTPDEAVRETAASLDAVWQAAGL